jgi:hypothetical protein
MHLKWADCLTISELKTKGVALEFEDLDETPFETRVLL